MEQGTLSKIETVWNDRTMRTGGLRALNPSRPWYRYAGKLLGRLPFSNRGGVSALDVGCGVGEFMSILQAVGFQTEGIDGSREQMDAVCSRGLRGRVGNLEEALPYPKESFGLVTCLELIEHIARAEALLSEIHRILLPGGCLLISTPNFSFINNRIHYLLGKGPLNEGIHVRYFTKGRFLELLRSSGFTIIEKTSYGPIPLLGTLMVRLFRDEPPLWCVKGFLEGLLAYDFVYLVRKG
jgi:2-polyprenyl-3-methyl-5-hydroxy-6-metoxy-1,4-benzoquinol methylase